MRRLRLHLNRLIHFSSRPAPFDLPPQGEGNYAVRIFLHFPPTHFRIIAIPRISPHIFAFSPRISRTFSHISDDESTAYFSQPWKVMEEKAISKLQQNETIRIQFFFGVSIFVLCHQNECNVRYRVFFPGTCGFSLLFKNTEFRFFCVESLII